MPLADTDIVRCTIEVRGHGSITVAQMRTLRNFVVDLWVECDAVGIYLFGGVQPSVADVP